MYLLSPEGKTVFFIPGVEVVHTTTTPLHLSEDFTAKVSPCPPLPARGQPVAFTGVSCAPRPNLGRVPALAAIKLDLALKLLLQPLFWPKQ